MPSQYRQNAEDVQAYRIENGYITRYVKKQLTADERKSIENSVRAILATQKSMTQSYRAALNSGSPMTKSDWDMRSDAAVDSYKAAILPYIGDTSMDAFEKFIIGRKNLMKNLFDKQITK